MGQVGGNVHGVLNRKMFALKSLVCEAVEDVRKRACLFRCNGISIAKGG